MDVQQQLYGLMAVAEEHQQAVKAALDGLAIERAAFARERAAVAQAAAEAIPAIQQAAAAAVAQSLAGASDAAAKALGDAAKPVIGSLSGVVRAAGEAEGKLKNAGAWFGWKWVAVAAGGLVGVCLVAYASLAWQLREVSSLRAAKAALQADVAQLQANVSALEQRGGRIVMTTCGGRLCIEASSNQGEGAEQWRGGAWINKAGVPLVIPRGY